ncbi:MAG: hypothetical protein J6X97_01735 [Lachnospiraceae bacterium]|nr:hypothetical protein [Lachnospiraceae bacterium]
MIGFFKTVKSIYLLVNNPVTKFLFKNLLLFIGFIIKWFFIILVGPISWFVFKLSFKQAFTKTLTKMLKKYFTVTFPKVLKKKLAQTYPVNLVSSFIKTS